MEAAIGRSVFLAVLVQLVVRLIVPDYVEMSGPETSYFIAGAVVVVAFFQPCLWWRTIVGYIAGVIIGIFAVTTSTIALTTLVAPGEIASESVYILIPRSSSGFCLLEAACSPGERVSPAPSRQQLAPL